MSVKERDFQRKNKATDELIVGGLLDHDESHAPLCLYILNFVCLSLLSVILKLLLKLRGPARLSNLL
jgi:hypothetical protein